MIAIGEEITPLEVARIERMTKNERMMEVEERISQFPTEAQDSLRRILKSFYDYPHRFLRVPGKAILDLWES
jgi:hypothetical protein